MNLNICKLTVQEYIILYAFKYLYVAINIFLTIIRFIHIQK